MRRTRKTIVLDTSAFVAGFDPSSTGDDFYSVSGVNEELGQESLPKLRFEAAAEKGNLKILEPEPTFSRSVRKASADIGDLKFLSDVDLKIVALALQLKHNNCEPTIITDDYSIQNVAKSLKIDFTSLTTYGIRMHLTWQIYCPACRKKYPSNYNSKQCQICGAILKRKPVEKRSIKTT